MLKIYDEPLSPHERGVFNMYDEPISPREGACFDEPVSPNEGACSRYMTVWSRQLGRRV